MKYLQSMLLVSLLSASVSVCGAQPTTTTTPPPSGSVSMTQILDEAGSLTNQESQTSSQQQTANTQAIKMQASDTVQQAQQMAKGAGQMMKGATAGLTVGMATSAMDGSASSKGDQAEKEQSSPQGSAQRKFPDNAWRK